MVVGGFSIVKDNNQEQTRTGESDEGSDINKAESVIEYLGRSKQKV